MTVEFRLVLRDQLPGVFQELAVEVGERAQADQVAAQARDAAVSLRRVVPDLAYLPRVGEEVLANPNFDPLVVLGVAHELDDARVVVDLGELDADQVGGDLALELLLAAGWELDEAAFDG